MRAPVPDDIALTGLGVVTALGRDLPSTFASLAAGNRAPHPTGDTDAGLARGHAAPIAPPLLRRPVPAALESQIKFLNGAGELAVEAALEAAAQAGLESTAVEPERRGLYLSQMESEDWNCSEFRAAFAEASESFTRPLEAQTLNRAAARRVKPFFMLESLKNNAFSFLATLHELRGANTSVAGFAGPTALALDLAARSLRRRTLDLALVVGAGRPASAMARVEMEDRGLTHAPTGGAGCPPPGDGAGAVVLERLADVPSENREAAVVLLGRGLVTHAPDPTAFVPAPGTLVAAAREALAMAQVEPGDLAGIVVPGVGESGLGEALDALPETAGAGRVAWKPQTGHLALASDAVEVALAAHALAAGVLPGVDGRPTRRAVLVLTAGLFGQCGALVLGRGAC